MQIDVTVRHFELSDNIKVYAEKEVDNLTQYFDRVIDAQVVFDQEHTDYIVQIVMRAPGKTISVTDTQDDVIKAIDGAVNKLRRRLKKYKAKLINH